MQSLLKQAREIKRQYEQATSAISTSVTKLAHIESELVQLCSAEVGTGDLSALPLLELAPKATSALSKAAGALSAAKRCAGKSRDIKITDSDPIQVVHRNDHDSTSLLVSAASERWRSGGLWPHSTAKTKRNSSR